MKIIHFSHCNLGSAEASTAHVMEFSEGLKKRGHDVTVLTPLKGIYKKETSCRMFYFPFIDIKGLRQPTAIISGFFTLLLLHKLFKFDLIYIRRITLDCFPAFFSRITGVPLIVETNGQIENHEYEVPVHFLWPVFWYPMLKLFERILFNTAFAVTADGDGRLQNFKRKYPDSIEKFKMIRSGGIDLDRFHRINKEEAKKELKLSRNKRYLVWVGTIFAWSGLEILIDAAVAICKKYDSIDFLIIGEGSERKNLMNSAGSKNILDRMTFTGYIPTEDLYKWLSASDIALAPYTRLRLDIEDFTSYKIYEYLSCGLPVVCSYESGGSNISYVNKYDFGKTVPPEDVNKFTEAIDTIINDKKYYTEDFVNRVRTTLLESNVTWDSVVGNVEELCNNAVE